MGSSYDEKFEFNAPKVRHGPTRATGEGHRVCGIFHDFTRTVEDDGADAWFDSQSQEGSAVKDTAVEVDQQDNLAVRRNAAASAVEPAEAESPTKESAPVEEPEPAQEETHEAVDEEVTMRVAAPVAQEAAPAPAPAPAPAAAPAAAAAPAPAAKSAAPVGKPEWKQAVGNGNKRDVSSKFAEDLLAFAAFKANEQEIKHLAESTVAACAEEMDASTHDPVALRTRNSLGRRSNGGATARSSMGRRGSNGNDLRSLVGAEKRGSVGRRSTGADKAEKAEKAVQAAMAEKAETEAAVSRAASSGDNTGAERAVEEEEVEANVVPTTPRFSRFAKAGKVASASTPQSAPRPSSARTPSSSLVRGTAASSARKTDAAPRSERKAPAASGPARKLTVPVSPNLRTSVRGPRGSLTSLGPESSMESLGSVSQQGSRSSLSGISRNLTVPRSPKLSTSNRASVSKSVEGTDALRMKAGLKTPSLTRETSGTITAGVCQEAEAAVEQLKKRRKLGEQRLRGAAADSSAATAATMCSAKTLTVPQSPACTSP
ncbi:hypothetical protein T484DRAFT_1768921 [Baffinella frigidus]|nr:hypothetical protein T484DRAFT_1768921 [Cryptophyta sp. CCMP2293]